MFAGARDRSDPRRQARYQGQYHHDSGYRTSTPGGIIGERQLVRTDHDAPRVGVPDRGFVERIGHKGQWRRALASALVALSMTWVVGCRHTNIPQLEFERLQQSFRHGELLRAQEGAEQAASYYSNRDPCGRGSFGFLIRSSRVAGMCRWILKAEPEPPTAVGDIRVPQTLERLIWAAKCEALEGLAYTHDAGYGEADSQAVKSRSRLRCQPAATPVRRTVSPSAVPWR